GGWLGVLQGQRLPPAAAQDRQAEQCVQQQQAPVDHGEGVDLGLGWLRHPAHSDQQPLHLGGRQHQGQPHRDRSGGVPQRVQQRPQQVPADQGARQPQPAALGGGAEQHPAQDGGPQPRAGGGQQPAQDLGLDQVRQRQPLH